MRWTKSEYDDGSSVYYLHHDAFQARVEQLTPGGWRAEVCLYDKMANCYPYPSAGEAMGGAEQLVTECVTELVQEWTAYCLGAA